MKIFFVGLVMFILGYIYCHRQLSNTYEKYLCVDIVKHDALLHYEACYEGSILNELKIKDVGYIGNENRLYKVRRIR